VTRKAASVVLTDDQGRLLLVHEDYGKRRWGLPGGRHEPGESIEETAIREAKEETNLDVELGELIGEYLIVSAGGERLLDVSVFAATVVSGEVRPQHGEIDDIGWFHPDRLPHPMTNTAPPAIADAVRGARGVHRRVVSAH
jgi:8-oxo-dGTP pyrophosphatase MutT (NUDIX family)